MLELSFMGEIAVRRDGERQVLPGSQKTRALLAYLAATGREHRREALCSLLWNVPDDPKGALRWSLSKLRHAVDAPDAPRLVADRETVSFDMMGAECDLFRLRAAAASDDLATLEAGAAIRGEFAPGLSLRGCDEFESWLLAAREDARQCQMLVWRKLVGLLEGEPERALPYARLIVENDPLGEAGWIQLVALLGESGRPEEAAAQRAVAIRTLEGEGIAVPDGLRRSARPAASPTSATPAERRDVHQRVEFCTAPDGTGLAYSCVGSGPPLVKAANWLNHLEFEWESPIWRHWIEELSRDRTLLRYDERGNGLSDWKVEDLSFEAFVQDLETVVEAAGLERFDLLGISQGCAVSIAYAVRHPEKVRSLILYGGYAQGWATRNDPEERARREAMVTLTGTGWGKANPAFRQMFTTLYFPEATDEQEHWFNEVQRISASPEGAQRLQRALSVIDVLDLVPQIKVPTLIMHSRDDAVVPFEAGRMLARLIDGARFVALESPNHLMLEQEAAWPKLVSHLREFLADPEG